MLTTKPLLNDAIQYYHDLLTPEIAEAADAEMRTKLKERSLYFGDRPLCVVLRPQFYTVDDWQFIKKGLEDLLSAFSTLHNAALEDEAVRKQLHLDPYEEELLGVDKAGVPPWTSSRLDTFFVPDERVLKVVEYNAETPAGIGYGDVLSQVFQSLEPMRRFRERYTVQQVESLGDLTQALIAGYRAWGGTQAKPQIAILDWREVPTINEHEISRDYFVAQGYPTKLSDPRQLEYRDGTLYDGDFRIDLIYKRVLYSELIGRMGMDNPVVKAMRDGNIYITNSISAKMLAKKASLASLSDERNEALFNKAQKTAIDEFIPWTRYVEERKTLYHGQEIDLIDFINENRNRLTLKPNDEYGGSGVVLGWQANDAEWAQTLEKALNEPHVVQERVRVFERDFPMWSEGRVDISPRFVDADPYIFGGNSVDGVLTRLSPRALLNVTAGGGSVVPAFIIDDLK